MLFLTQNRNYSLWQKDFSCEEDSSVVVFGISNINYERREEEMTPKWTSVGSVCVFAQVTLKFQVQVSFSLYSLCYLFFCS